MITLGKFNTLKEKALPALLSAASKVLEADISSDRDTLVEVVDGMDQIVFDEFVKRRSHNLVKVMEEGILHSGIDWLNTSKPTGESVLESEASASGSIQYTMSPLEGRVGER